MSLTRVHVILNRWYWHKIRLKRATPLYHQKTTQEIDFPYRNGMGHIFHLWPTKLGVTIGRWSGKGTSQSLLEAVDGEDIGEYVGCGEGCAAQHDAIGLGEDLDAGGTGHKDDVDEYL